MASLDTFRIIRQIERFRDFYTDCGNSEEEFSAEERSLLNDAIDALADFETLQRSGPGFVSDETKRDEGVEAQNTSHGQRLTTVPEGWDVIET